MIGFGCLYLFGTVLGSWFSCIQTSSVRDNLSISGPLKISCSTSKILRDFLIDNIFYLLVIFIFGLTFLGVVVIPISLISRGVVHGIAFTVLFPAINNSAYVYICILHVFFIICTVLISVFAEHAFVLSIRFCKQICKLGSFQVCWMQYGIYFVLTFISVLATGGVYTLANCLLTKFF